MTLYGLGLGLTGCLTPAQLYQLALSAGFPPGTTINQGNAGTMAAIAMKESSGCPTATNLTGNEQSYGLWQINVQANPISGFGLSDPTQLLDPTTNAQAAYQLWNGSDSNLNIAWSIQDGGMNQSRYLANMATVQAAVGGSDISSGGILSAGILPADDGSGGGLSTMAVAGIAAAAVALVLLLRR